MSKYSLSPSAFALITVLDRIGSLDLRNASKTGARELVSLGLARWEGTVVVRIRK